MPSLRRWLLRSATGATPTVKCHGLIMRLVAVVIATTILLTLSKTSDILQLMVLIQDLILVLNQALIQHQVVMISALNVPIQVMETVVHVLRTTANGPGPKMIQQNGHLKMQSADASINPWLKTYCWTTLQNHRLPSSNFRMVQFTSLKVNKYTISYEQVRTCNRIVYQNSILSCHISTI